VDGNAGAYVSVVLCVEWDSSSSLFDLKFQTTKIFQSFEFIFSSLSHIWIQKYVSFPLIYITILEIIVLNTIYSIVLILLLDGLVFCQFISLERIMVRRDEEMK